jgi:Glucose / Sorbosone dehydrogenase
VISRNSKIGVPAVFTWLILIGGVLVFQNCSANHRNTTQSGSLIDPKAPESSPTLTGQVTLPSPGSAVVPTLLRTDFLNGLNIPRDLAFTPDQAVLFTEKCRGLSVRRTNGAVSRLFGTSGAALVAGDFFCEGQSGMHGTAIDPNFINNRTIYVYMPSNLSNPRTNRVVRLVVDAGYTMVKVVLILLLIFHSKMSVITGEALAHTVEVVCVSVRTGISTLPPATITMAHCHRISQSSGARYFASTTMVPEPQATTSPLVGMRGFSLMAIAMFKASRFTPRQSKPISRSTDLATQTRSHPSLPEEMAGGTLSLNEVSAVPTTIVATPPTNRMERSHR